MLSAEQVYNVYAEASAGFGGGTVPLWYRLDWPSRDRWQRMADELNAADREEPTHAQRH